MTPQSTRPSTQPTPSKRDARVSLRLYQSDVDLMDYWAKQQDSSRAEFLVDAMHHYIAYLNDDVSLSTPLLNRVNQLTDAVQSLVITNENLTRTVVQGFDVTLGLMRGANYLVEDESGDV